MRTALSMSLVASALVCGLCGCGATSNTSADGDRGDETEPVDVDDGGGANPDDSISAGSVLDAATLCDASPDFGFQIAAAATVPSFDGDLAARMASVQVASTGAGTIVLPFLGASTFASVFSATPTTPSGSLTENPDCPQNN